LQPKCCSISAPVAKRNRLQSRHLAGLDLVEAVVTAYQQQPDRGAQQIALGREPVGGQHQGFHGVLQWHPQQIGHVLAGGLAGRGRLGQGRGRRRALADQRQRLGQLDVGGIVAGSAVDERVLASVGDDLELVRGITTDGAGVGGHRAVLKPETVEDAAIGLVHELVAAQRASLVAVEGIRILHRELASAHDAEARPPLVAELGLDVIEISRQLLVAAQFLPRDVGDDLFAGGLDDEVALVPVLHAQQFRPVGLEAARLLPQLGRLYHRHQQLDGAGGVHLFADDGLDLADHAQAHRHVAVDARAQALDHAGAQHQAVVTTSASAGAFQGETKNWRLSWLVRGSLGPRSAAPTLASDAETEGPQLPPGRNNEISHRSRSDYARPRLQAQRRHRPAQRTQPGVLGQAAAHALVAVSARRHQLR
jgi:hypothetical protein